MMNHLGSGMVEACIDAMNGELESLYDDQNLRDGFGRLPNPSRLTGRVRYESGSVRDTNGQSSTEQDSEHLRYTNILLYEDETVAAKVGLKREDWFPGHNWDSWENFLAQRDGRYIRYTVHVDPDVAFTPHELYKR